jgi:hypothetical protein
MPTTTTDRQTARSFGPIRICRGTESQLEHCAIAVGEAMLQPSNGTTHSRAAVGSYTDTLPRALLGDNPGASVTYAIEVPNAEGRSAGLSNQVHVPLVRTLPAPRDFEASVTAQGVVLNWTSDAPPAPAPTVHYVYRVYRRQEGTHQQILAGEVTAGESALSLTDSSIEWERTYFYHADAVTVIGKETGGQEEVEGDDSQDAKVFADDVFPPAVPSGLQAVFSGPGQQPFIDLIWAPDTDADLAGYNIYRREEGQPPVKLNPELVKTLAYRDASVAPGTHYLYSVTAVDLRGNESARSEEAGETVP